MPVKLTGRFDSGPNKGRQFEIYQDPASKTGWTRKNWNPYDTANGGKPTENFEEFDYGAAEVDADAADRASANAAAAAAKKQADQEAALGAKGKSAEALQAKAERDFQEGVRRYNTTEGRQAAEEERLRQQGNRELDLKAVDQRTRLQLGLRELELREREGGNTDARARERNVLDYIQGIGRLRLPLAELRALSQRAVQGIVPGAPVGSPAQVAPNGSGGALTADQWAALGEGVARDYETRQIGQGSGLAA